LGAGPLLLACAFSMWRFRAWRRSVQNPAQNCCGNALLSSGRGTCPWLWRFVPFTVRCAAGSPIILFFLHRLLPQWIPVRRRRAGLQPTPLGGGLRRDSGFAQKVPSVM